MTLQTPEPLKHHNLSPTFRTARELVTDILAGDIDLNPPYQRGSVWSVGQRMGLIRSWLHGLPIPGIVVNDRFNNRDWTTRNGTQHDPHGSIVVIDGKQRLETAVAWFTGKLHVPATWFEPEWVAETIGPADDPYTTHDMLTRAGQHAVRALATLPLSTTYVASLEEEAEIYLLVNGEGVAQDASDITRAAAIAGQPVLRSAARETTAREGAE